MSQENVAVVRRIFDSINQGILIGQWKRSPKFRDHPSNSIAH